MAEDTHSQTSTDGPTGLPVSARSGGVYRLIHDAGERWISKPDNGGDLGDMQDAVAELNRLLDLLQRTHYNLIGRHGWGDADATLIGDAMGWDSGNQNVQALAQQERNQTPTP